MKRVRKNSNTNQLGLFQIAPIKKVERVRKDKELDPFIVKNKGKDPFKVLQEFLEARRAYIESDYTLSYTTETNKQLVLFELNLYSQVLERIMKITIKN